MEEISYLTRELKEYYITDFQKLLSFKDSEFWAVIKIEEVKKSRIPFLKYEYLKE